MKNPDLIGLFVEPLETIAVPYMVTGGVASVIYGDPRFTRDVDIVIQLAHGDIAALVSAFDGAAFYVPPPEALEEEASRGEGGHFNIIHRETALRADVYVAGDDPFVAWAFDSRVRLQVGRAGIWIAPIEYVIVRKLEYYQQSGSDRHLRDVAMMLRISAETVDPSDLREWSERRKVQEALDRARRYSPD